MSEERSDIQQLRNELAHQEHRIFVLESPTISPKDYWQMRDQLAALEREAPTAECSSSATLRRPPASRLAFEVFPHSKPGPEVLALQSTADLQRYYLALEAQEGIKPICVGTGQIDGPELELFYADGTLEKAILLQSDDQAIDVTDNARTIGSIPLILKPAGSVTDTRVSKVVRQKMGPSTMSPVPAFSQNLVIRGRVSMRCTDFVALDRQRIDAGQPPYVEPKAALLSSIRSLDPRKTSSRRLQFFAETVRSEILNIESHWQLLSALKSWGFCVMPLMWRCEGLPELLDFVATLQQQASNFAYPLCGGGLHLDRLIGLRADAQVSRSAHFIFPEVGPVAMVKSVYRAVGRTGAVLPVAMLDAVKSGEGEVPDGAPIPAYSGSQVLALQSGAQVRILRDRAGPPLIRPLDSGRQTGLPRLQKCPSCESKLRYCEDEPFAYCDEKTCPGRNRSWLLHIIGPNGLDLKSISIRTAEALLGGQELTLLRVLRLEPKDVETHAPQSGHAFAKEIARWKKIPFWKALYLSNIDHLCEQDARCLAAFASKPAGLQRLLDFPRPAERLCGISPESYDGMIRWLEAGGLDSLQTLRQAGFELLDDGAVYSAVFRGRRAVVSGEFKHLSQEQIRADVERYGGRVDAKVTRMTDILILGAEAKSDLEAARYYGTTLMTEALFIAVLRLIESS